MCGLSLQAYGQLMKTPQALHSSGFWRSLVKAATAFLGRLSVLMIGMAIALTGASNPSLARDDPIPVIDLHGGEFEIYPARGQASFLQVEKGALTVEQAAARLDQFSPVRTRNLDFEATGTQAADIWIHFRVRNASDTAQRWVTDFHRPLSTVGVDAYRIEASGAFSRIFECSEIRCESAFGSKYISGLIELSPGEQTDVLMRMDHRFSSQSPVRFATVETYLVSEAATNSASWVINGFWLGLLSIALLLGRVIGWRLSFAFVMHSGISLLLISLSVGLLYLNQFAPLVPHTEGILFQLGIITFLHFGRTFFRTWERQPKMDKFLLAIMAVSVINLLGTFVGNVDFSRMITQGLSLVAAVAQLSLAIHGVRERWAGSTPVLIGTVLVTLAALHDASNKLVEGSVSRDAILQFSQFAFFFEAMFFAIAISLKVIRLQQERDAALKTELLSSRRQLSLTKELQASQRRFERAKGEAESRRQEIEALGHDLMQPLRALRSAFSARQIGTGDKASDADTAFALLEELATRSAAEVSIEDLPEVETFPVSVLLANVQRMFLSDAIDAGVHLKFCHSSAIVSADPLALMRILTNLLSNALQHSEASRILVGCRILDGAIAIEVHDDGKGIPADELARLLRPRERGADSKGNGLGLPIVKQLCSDLDYDFQIESRPGGGTVARTILPLADDNRPE